MFSHSSLLLLARTRIDPRLESRVDPAALVQEALRQGQDVDPRLQLARVMANALRQLSHSPQATELERFLAERARARCDLWLAAEESPGQRLACLEDESRLLDILATLSEPQREVVVLRFFHGWKVGDIAQRLGVSLADVATLLQAGLTALQPRPEDDKP